LEGVAIEREREREMEGSYMFVDLSDKKKNKV
jgi:hypothetical protein